MTLSPMKKKIAKLKRKKLKFKDKSSSDSTIISAVIGQVNTRAGGTERGSGNNVSQQAQADAALDTASSLPPEGSSTLVRLAHFLMNVLKELDPNKKDNKKDNKEDADETEVDVEASNSDDPQTQQRITTASQNLSRADANAAPLKRVAKVGGAAVATATKSASALARKNPDEMSAKELGDAIGDAEKALKKGKILLPADAGILARALAVLAKALMELGGVESNKDLADKEKLQELIKQKHNTQSTDSKKIKQQQAAVQQAVAGVQEAQAEVANNRLARGEPVTDLNNTELNAIKAIDADNMDAQSIANGIDNIDKAAVVAKTLLPEDASLLQRVLAVLKRALLELGGIDPDENMPDSEDLQATIEHNQTTLSNNNVDLGNEKAVAKVKTAVTDVKEAEAQVARNQKARGELGGAANTALRTLAMSAVQQEQRRLAGLDT